jgi:iron-sulfur cluster repair protein YtfE (RIC family)
MSTEIRDELFEQWKAEHREIGKFMHDLSQWISNQTKQRASQFQETVNRLNDLNSQLQAHFAREEALSIRLCESYQFGSPEAVAVGRQSDRDHADISNRIKQLADRMTATQSEQDAWTKGVFELGLIMDLIEQHEEQESESVCCLLPTKSN